MFRNASPALFFGQSLEALLRLCQIFFLSVNNPLTRKAPSVGPIRNFCVQDLRMPLQRATVTVQPACPATSAATEPSTSRLTPRLSPVPITIWSAPISSA